MMPCPIFLQGIEFGSTRRRGDRLFHTGFPQELGCFLGRSRIDIETGAPFEAGGFRQFRHELHVPVVVVIGRILHGRAVNHQVVRRVIQYAVRLGQQCLHRFRQVLEHV